MTAVTAALDTPLYTRYQDGSQPVTILDQGGSKAFRLEDPQSRASRVYTSARQLLITVTGHPKARNWTFDRYFRTGRYAPEGLTVAPTIPVADLLLLGDATALTVASGGAGPTVLTGHGLGIDLDKRGHEVTKLLMAGFGPQIFASGWDPDDVLQEVYKGILTRNRGRCPWDARKSSFGHYVHMVIRCVLSNYARKQRRIQAVEQVGVKEWDDGELRNVDVARSVTAKKQAVRTVEEVEGDLRNLLKAQGARTAARVLPLIHAGYTRAEIARRLGLSRAGVAKAVAHLRELTRGWEPAMALGF